MKIIFINSLSKDGVYKKLFKILYEITSKLFLLNLFNNILSSPTYLLNLSYSVSGFFNPGAFLVGKSNSAIFIGLYLFVDFNP